MRKIILPLLGLIFLTFLSFFCFQSKVDDIRDDLISRTKLAMDSNGYNWVDVDLEGKDLKQTNIIKLSGTAPSNEAKLNAKRLALGIVGVGGVKNLLKVSSDDTLLADNNQNSNQQTEEDINKQPTIAPIAKNISETKESLEDKNSSNNIKDLKDNRLLADNKKTDSKIYQIYMLKKSDGKIIIDGYVNDKKEHKQLIDHAYKLFDKNSVVDKIKERSDAPKDWLYISEFALEKLSEVDYGDMNITDYSYVFNAHLPSNDSKIAFLNSIKEVMSNPDNHYGRYRGDYIVTAPIAGATPASIENQQDKVAKVSCQELLDKAIKSRKIHFAYDRADIQQDSYKILDDIVNAFKTCNQNNFNILEIDGHTDSIGSAIYNKKLSQKRANAVKNYLVQKGINPDKLKAVGFGESRPIASNMTESGRAQNRRIEFIIKGVK